LPALKDGNAYLTMANGMHIQLPKTERDRILSKREASDCCAAVARTERHNCKH
jgi:hypothetical protein